MSGLLVTLEGIDNAGKTSVCERLTGRFTGLVVTRELTTPVGKVLKESLRSRLPLTPEEKVVLFAADRLERQRTTVGPALADGRLVLADRWVHSAIAYRRAEVPKERRPRITEYVRAVNRPCLQPSLAVYLDISVALSRARDKGKDWLLPQEDLEQVRTEYLDLVEQHELESVDGMRDLDTVAEDIAARVAELFKPNA